MSDPKVKLEQRNAEVIAQLIDNGDIENVFESPDDRAVTIIVCHYYMQKFKDIGIISGGAYDITPAGLDMAEKIINAGWVLPIELATWFVMTNPSFGNHIENMDANLAIISMLTRVSEQGLSSMYDEVRDYYDTLSDAEKLESGINIANLSV